jgi:hypothetical protein
MEQTYTSSKNVNPSSYTPGSLKEKASEFFDRNESQEEGETTKAIESQTSKLPSVFFLSLALGSMAISAVLATTTRRKNLANFVGLWVPTFLMFGLYNKIVKTHGSDREMRA